MTRALRNVGAPSESDMQLTDRSPTHRFRTPMMLSARMTKLCMCARSPPSRTSSRWYFGATCQREPRARRIPNARYHEAYDRGGTGLDSEFGSSRGQAGRDDQAERGIG